MSHEAPQWLPLKPDPKVAEIFHREPIHLPSTSRDHVEDLRQLLRFDNPHLNGVLVGTTIMAMVALTAADSLRELFLK